VALGSWQNHAARRPARATVRATLSGELLVSCLGQRFVREKNCPGGWTCRAQNGSMICDYPDFGFAFLRLMEVK
jgi:hypothetical protein